MNIFPFQLILQIRETGKDLKYEQLPIKVKPLMEEKHRGILNMNNYLFELNTSDKRNIAVS